MFSCTGLVSGALPLSRPAGLASRRARPPPPGRLVYDPIVGAWTGAVERRPVAARTRSEAACDLRINTIYGWRSLR